MHKYIRILLGLNLSAVIRGFRFGFAQFRMAPSSAYETVNPFEDRLLAGIPKATLLNITSGRNPRIIVEVSNPVDGALPLEARMAVLSLLVLEQPKVILEIGTFMGATTRAMAENLPECLIHTVDLPESYVPGSTAALPKDDFHLIQARVVGRDYKNTPFASRITQHFADTAKWDFTAAAPATFFFIDGSHTYEYCKSDSEKCFQLCNGRGVFLWHDCDDSHPGVVRFLTEWRAMGRDIVCIVDTQLAYWKSL
jgi:hypothetical protein